MRPTISLAMIARDRARELTRVLGCMREHVDEIVVVDAGGSEDDTCEVARSFGAKVVEFLSSEHPEAFYDDVPERFARHEIPGPYTGRKALADFSTPRNASFAACTQDLILWLDSDDIVKNPEKIRDVVQVMVDKDLESVFFRYDYEHDEQGRCITRQIRERIVRRADFQSGKVRWKFPIHEHLTGLSKGGLFEEVTIVHQSKVQDSSVVEKNGLHIYTAHRDKVSFRNLKNLIVEKERLEAAGENMPWRLAFYLGTEMRPIDPEAAIKHLFEYLGKSLWDEERSQARAFIAQIREMQLRNEEAWDLYAGAAMDFPSNPSPWFGMARVAFVRGQWDKVIELSEKGFAQVGDGVIKKPALVTNPLEWQYRAHLPYSRALIEIGRIEDALKSCEAGLSVEPECKFLAEHKAMCIERIENEKAA